MAHIQDCCRAQAQLHSLRRAPVMRIQFERRDRLMLRKLSLALAVSCASNGMAWAAEAPLSTLTDLVSVYQEAVDNNADLAAARAQYGAQKEVVPQARAGLLPNLSAGADLNNTRTELDQPAMTATRSSTVYQATLSQP